MKLVKEPVIVDFIEFDDGKKFDYNQMVGTINQFLDETKENDSYGDYSLRDYELVNKDVTNYLIKLGLVKSYIGPRMSHCYCLKDMKGLEKLINDIDILYFKGEK